MNIKDIRAKTNMTQKEFAEYLNIPQRTIENWEGDKRNPPDYVVELIKYKVEKERLEMIKKDEIFLVITEDGQIIYDIEEKDLALKDQIIFESDIENLVEIEIDEYTHEDEKEDYDTELEFYISNAAREDYASYFIPSHLVEVKFTEEAKQIVQQEVIDRIKDRLD